MSKKGEGGQTFSLFKRTYFMDGPVDLICKKFLIFSKKAVINTWQDSKYTFGSAESNWTIKL